MTDESSPRGDEPTPTVRNVSSGRRRGSPSLLDRAATLFEEARHLDSTARPAFIAARAGHDAELRAELERLLAHASASGLDTNARDGIARAATDFMDGGSPDHVGHYRVLRRLGEGGMGTVYEAEQDEPRRRVALKLVRADIASPELLRRFRTETEALGRLSHPGIGQIFEAGVAELPGRPPQPFFAMELIEGASLLAHVRERGLATSERLELIAQVCDAVQHAHRRGIVHRDLKPDNVLVTGDGRIKVLDFGVARATAGDLTPQTLQTTAGEILGTVPYMSPEQVGGRPEAIDHRSDVYSLGVIAFELVAERRPYALERLALPEAARVIRDEEPTSLGTLNPRWRGDVETIIGGALEEDPERRYQSAADMAEDIRRFLRNEPIAARGPSARYRLSKFARRNRSLVAGVLGVIVALALGVGVATRLAVKEARQRVVAEKSEQRSLHQAYRASLAAAQGALRDGLDVVLQASLERVAEK